MYDYKEDLREVAGNLIDTIDSNPPKNASYWKQQAKRLQEELLTANCRITELEKKVADWELLDFEDGRIAELEEACADHLKSARKNWDAYQMETDKTEKLSAENTKMKELIRIMASYPNSGRDNMTFEQEVLFEEIINA